MLWRGIFKLIEEMSELGQVLGKLGPFPTGEHPDGKGSLRMRATEEIADVYAALDYFAETNNFNEEYISNRRAEKLNKFRQWTLDGVPDTRQVPAIVPMTLLKRFQAFWSVLKDGAPRTPLG